MKPTPEEITKLQTYPGFAGREAHRPSVMRNKALEAIRRARAVKPSATFRCK